MLSVTLYAKCQAQTSNLVPTERGQQRTRDVVRHALVDLVCLDSREYSDGMINATDNDVIIECW